MALHTHLRRLDRVWVDSPLYFVTTCTYDRRPILTVPEAATVLCEEWHAAKGRHGWVVGRYVIMPDHVHFFCRPQADSKPLAAFMRVWKQWTAKRILRVEGMVTPIWQTEFFDHVLRSTESYAQKWEYVRANPVRAGLVRQSDEWPWQGEIDTLALQDR